MLCIVDTLMDLNVMIKAKPKKRFHVILIKPSKYDDEGYVIRWWRAVVTSNSLACMNALTEDVRDREGLGPGVDMVIHLFDETVQKIPVQKLGSRIRNAGDRGIVCLVGVQSNQFPRAVDLAREFKREGLASMIGGFHVSLKLVDEKVWIGEEFARLLDAEAFKLVVREGGRGNGQKQEGWKPLPDSISWHC